MTKHLLFALISQFCFAVTVHKPLSGEPPPGYYKYYFYDCDACGCSASGGSMGYSSMLNNNFIGLRYIKQSYTSRDGIFNNSPWIDENFNTVQAWARLPLGKRFEVMALLPYHFNSREKVQGTEHIDGLGDITAMGFYTVYSTVNNSAVIRHKFQVGAGIKLPTGKFDTANNGSVNPSFQLGTGSWDYTIATEYTIRKKSLGINAVANYVIKSSNNKNYQFGNQFNYAGTVFYEAGIGKLVVVPQAGLAGELYASNKDHGEAVPATDGRILFAKAGLETGYKNFSFGIQAMLPIEQHLVGGKVEANYRISLNLNYIFM